MKLILLAGALLLLASCSTLAKANEVLTEAKGAVAVITDTIQAADTDKDGKLSMKEILGLIGIGTGGTGLLSWLGIRSVNAKRRENTRELHNKIDSRTGGAAGTP